MNTPEPEATVPTDMQPDVQFGLAVRARRAQLGITLDQLATASGVSPGALSRVERGLLSVSLRNAMAIAKGLDCELSELVHSPVSQITRAGDYLRFVDESTGVERLALAQPTPGVRLLQYRVPPGAASSHFAAHRTGTREVFHLLEGQLTVYSGAESMCLQAGDTATLAMDTEHHFSNTGAVSARLILLVISPPGN